MSVAERSDVSDADVDDDTSGNEYINFGYEYDSSVSDGEDEKIWPSTSRLELERRDRSRGDGKIEAEATGSDEGTKNENTKKADEEFDFKVIGLEKVPPTSKSRPVIASWLKDVVGFSPNVASQTNPLDTIPLLAPELLQAVCKLTDRWFPVQNASLPILLQQNLLPHRDAVICSPTGSGKTLCYVLPILNSLRNVKASGVVFALIIAPVQNLVEQIYKELIKLNVYGATIVALNGSTEYSAERLQLFPNSSRVSQAHIIASTPGRLVEHLVDPSGLIDLSMLRYLVIDEADRMQDTARMEWLNMVERRANVPSKNSVTIANMCSNESNRWLQKILASATLSLDIHNLFTWNLRCPQLFKSEFTVGKADVSTSQNSMTSGAGHANVKHKSEHAILQTLVLPNSLDHLMVISRPEIKPSVLYYYLKLKEKEWRKIIVFVNKKETGHRLRFLLSKMCGDSFDVHEFSSNLYGKRRARILRKFQLDKENTVQVLISCDVLSRGMDITNLDCVVNYDAPINERIFVHRAGRTGRALRQGIILTIATKEERLKLRAILTEQNLWCNVTDIRDVESCLGKKVMKRYEKALHLLRERFQ